MVWQRLLQLTGLARQWPQFTEDEVAQHCTTSSLWIVADGSVYDVTPILSIHPGGDAALLKRGGGAKDCARDFAYHSYATRRDIARYKIGELAAATQTRVATCSAAQPTPAPQHTRASNGMRSSSSSSGCVSGVAAPAVAALPTCAGDKDDAGQDASSRDSGGGGGGSDSDDGDDKEAAPRGDARQRDDMDEAAAHHGRFAVVTNTVVPSVTATTLDYLAHTPAPR